jgi:hypothetical protein
VIQFIARGTITEEEAAKELGELRQRQSRLLTEKDRLAAELENVPGPEAVKAMAEKVSTAFQWPKRLTPTLWAKMMHANTYVGEMPWEERRALAEMVFGGKTADGSRMGVYVQWVEGQQGRRKKSWHFRIAGRLIDRWGRLPTIFRASNEDIEPGGAFQQRDLLELVTKSSSY